MALDLSEVNVTLSTDVALYLLNNKKDFISSIEKRGLKIRFSIDPTIAAADFKIAHVMKPVTEEDESQQATEEKLTEHNNNQNRRRSNIYSRQKATEKIESTVSENESNKDVEKSSSKKRNYRTRTPEKGSSAEPNEKSSTYTTKQRKKLYKR